MDSMLEKIHNVSKELESTIVSMEKLRILEESIVKNGINSSIAVQLESIGIITDRRYYPTYQIGYNTIGSRHAIDGIKEQVISICDKESEYAEILQGISSSIISERPRLTELKRRVENAMMHIRNVGVDSIINRLIYDKESNETSRFGSKYVDPYEVVEDPGVVQYVGSFIVAANELSDKIDDYFNVSVSVLESELVELLNGGNLLYVLRLIAVKTSDIIMDGENRDIFTMKGLIKDIEKLYIMKRIIVGLLDYSKRLV